MAHELVLRGGLQIISTPGSGTGDPQLTLDIATKIVGEVPAVDSSTFISKTLAAGNILVGSNANIATAVPVTGVISLSSGGITTLQAGVIFDSNVNASAGIVYSKLNLVGSIVNTDINASAAITRTKLAVGTAYRVIVNSSAGIISELAALTAARVLVSDANGQPIAANPSTTEINFVAGVTSAIQTQLGNRLSFSSAITPVTGDIIIYSGGAWTRLPIGTAGQVLNVTAGLPAWGAATANGLPTGGTAGQYLNKIDGTNYNTQWSTLTLSKVTDVTATFTEVNKLSGVTTTTAQFNYLNTSTSDIQTQINSKLSLALAQNAMWYGNGSNVAIQLSPGITGYVLTSVGGVPTWQPTGTVITLSVVSANGLAGTVANPTTAPAITLSTTITGVLKGNGTAISAATAGTDYQAPLVNGSGLTFSTDHYDLGGPLTSSPTISGGFNILLTSGTSNGTLTIVPTIATLNGGSGVVTIAPTANIGASSISSHLLFGNAQTFQTSNVSHAMIYMANGILPGGFTGNTFYGIYYTPSGAALGTTIKHYSMILASGLAGIGVTAPTATLHLGAGTATNGPFKLTSGTLVTTIAGGVQDGLIEYDGTHFSAVIGSTRYQLDQQAGSPAWLLASGGTLTGANTIDQTTTAGNIVKFLTPNLGVTSIDGKGLWIQNATAAAAGAQQISGGVLWEGQGWATTPVASQSVKFMADVLLVQGAANPSGTWRLRSNVNGIGYVNLLSISTIGNVTFPTVGNICVPTNTTIFPNSGQITFYTGAAGAQVTRALTIVAGTTGNVNIGPFNVGDTAKLYVAQEVLSSSWLPVLRIDPGAHTSMTAATEFKDYNFTTRTATWLAGTTATQRFAHFQGQTVAGASASATFTDLYTVYIDPSIVGTNASVTRNWALGVGGNMRLGSNGNLFIGESSADPLIYSQSSVNPLYLGSTGIGHDTYVRGANFYIITGASAEAMRVTSAANVLIGSTSSNARLYVVQAALTTTGGLPAIRVDGGAHTNLTASVEVLFANFNSSATVQYATGSQAILRNILVQAPTIGFVGASTITDNATFTISGAPKAGTNTTQTNTHGLLIQAGAVISAGSAFGLTVNAPTGGTANYAGQFIGATTKFAISTTGYAPINLGGNGTAPTSPVDGDLWTTSVAAFVRINGSTVQLGSGGTGWAVTGTTVITGNTNQTGAFNNIFNLNSVSVTQNAQSAASVSSGFTFTGGAHTNTTASLEVTDVSFNLNRTIQLATGALTIQRAFNVASQTIAFVGASTITNAATFATSAPTAGANATITNSHAILIQAGGLGGTITNSYGLTANAQTGATNNYAAQFLGGNVGIGISAPVSTLDILGSLGTKIRTITASATAAATDYTLLCDSTGGVVAVTLPAASGATGRIYVIKKIDASANNVTLATVDGGTKTITTRYSGFAVQSDGSLWYVIASF